MSVALWIMLSVLILAVIGVTIALSRARGVGRSLTAELEAEQTAHSETRRSGEHLETRMRTLRNELAESHQTNAELTARVGRTNPADANRALGLWALERHRQARAAGTPLLGLAIGPGIDLTNALADSVRVELEVLREDVGTHAELTTVDLAEDLDARAALTILRIVQELAAILAKRADELNVSIGRDGDIVIVTVAAIGWTDTPPNATAFESGLAALDGTLELRRDSDDADTLLAIVRIGSPDDA